jgi:N-acetylmuramoyl-L-alanine amidase
MPKTIVGDAGHTPQIDPGACANGLQEVDLAGDILSRVQAKLAFYDVDFLPCPRTDDLSERAKFANDVGADYFLSLHINAGGGTGFESYVYTEASAESERVRGLIHASVMEHVTPFGVTDRGRKAANFAVLRETNMPAALLECLFVDNATDAELLKNDTFLNAMSNGIAWGVVVAFDLQKKAFAECITCVKYKELAAERDKLYAQNNAMRQELKQIANRAMPYLANGA